MVVGKQTLKTIVAIIIWNRFENLQRWIRCWNLCDRTRAELVIIHNQEQDNARYAQLCQDNKVKYVPRKNIGFDLGAFQDVCKERLAGFPNVWNNLIWITDDCIPMKKDFVVRYLNYLKEVDVPCLEISDEVKRHVRTTGFLITKELSKRLKFPRDPIRDRQDCYIFEHLGFNMYEQIQGMGFEPCMLEESLENAPLWDSGCRNYLNLMPKHEKEFPVETNNKPVINMECSSYLDGLAVKHKCDKSSLFHNFAEKYDRLLSSVKDSFTSILEIGVASGASLRMWADYFPNAIINGADISEPSRICESYSNRIKFHLMDQSNLCQLKNLEPLGKFDLVVDDGPHYWREQIMSFQTLFPYVKKGGLYIIEDTATSYDGQPYANGPISCVNFFKGLIDDVNLHGRPGRAPQNPAPDFTQDYARGWHRREDCHDNVPDFESIQFMNSLIVIRKR